MTGRAVEPRIGSLAALVGWTGPVALVSLIVFFAVGGPFGFINDVANATLAVLAGAFAVNWLRAATSPDVRLRVATALALVGVAVAVVGSVLIIFDVTGFFLAGLVSASGFALVGVWLLTANLSPALRSDVVVPRDRKLGVLAGAVMALGLFNLPGIVMGLDDQADAPVWLLALGVCWAGTYLLMPIWCLRLRRHAG